MVLLVMDLLIVSFLLLILCVEISGDFYWDARARFLQREDADALGSSLGLSEKESQVNDVLMEIKWREFDEAFVNLTTFLPAIHFFKGKAKIEESEVYKFIQKIPKGALLHSHDNSLTSWEFIYNLTFSEDLYGCKTADDRLRLRFFACDAIDNTCEWKLLSQWREEDGNFDEYLKAQMTMIVDNPEVVYKDFDGAWRKFRRLFSIIESLISYRLAFQEYMYQVFEEFYNDGVIFVELRTGLRHLYELNGTTYDYEYLIESISEISKEFKKHHPDFLGFGLIYTGLRKVDNASVADYIDTVLYLQDLYPEVVLGMDLAGQENLGEPLISFAEQLLNVSSQIKFFFHAAETNWNGASTDLNLVDAVLLNTTRIGHGFSIIKHQEVLRMVKERDIAIEVNPISNQVLELVEDLREHSGAFLISAGYPVVISCDNPTFWGAHGLSYDWYMAFMGLASRSRDLRLLKQLAINSLKYSAMDSATKEAAFRIWERQWERFLDHILTN